MQLGLELGGILDAIEESIWMALVFFILPHLWMTWCKRKGRERLRAEEKEVPADEVVKTSCPLNDMVQKTKSHLSAKTLSEASTDGGDSDAASTTDDSDTRSECRASVCSSIEKPELPSTTRTTRRCKMTDHALWEKHRDERNSERWERGLIKEVKRKNVEKKWLATGDEEEGTNANVQRFLNPRTQFQKNERNRLEVAKEVYNMLMDRNTDVSYRTYVLLIEIAILHNDLGQATKWAEEMETKHAAQPPQKIMDKMTNLFCFGPSEKAENAGGLLNPVSPEQDRIIKALSAHPWFCKSKGDAKVMQNQVIGCDDGTLFCLSMHSPVELDRNEVQWPPPCRWDDTSDFSMRRLKLISGPGAPGCMLKWGEANEDIVCDFEMTDIESGQLVWKKVSTGLTWQWSVDPLDLPQNPM